MIVLLRQLMDTSEMSPFLMSKGYRVHLYTSETVNEQDIAGIADVLIPHFH